MKSEESFQKSAYTLRLKLLLDRICTFKRRSTNPLNNRYRLFIDLPTESKIWLRLITNLHLPYKTNALTDQAKPLKDEADTLTDKPNALTDKTKVLTEEFDALTVSCNLLTDA